MLQPTRCLLELGPAFLPNAVYLHVFDDGSHDWSADKTKALRFASRADAERFGFANLDCDFIASEHPASDLVGGLDDDPQHEVDDLAAF